MDDTYEGAKEDRTIAAAGANARAGTAAWAVALMLAIAGAGANADTDRSHRELMRDAWRAYDNAEHWSCAKTFARAAHAGATEHRAREAIARAAYWAAECAERAGRRGAVEWRAWITETFPGSFHAALLKSNHNPAQEPSFGQWTVSVIAIESRGRANAQSPKGAIGVMQIMPKTARSLVAASTSDARLNRCLWNARCNRTLGERYLRRLLARNGGRWIEAIASYNGGPDAGDRLGADAARLGPIAAIDRIRVSETRNYVARVLAALWKGMQIEGRDCSIRRALVAGRWPGGHRRRS